MNKEECHRHIHLNDRQQEYISNHIISPLAIATSQKLYHCFLTKRYAFI